ncbi:hypothetical protein BDR26DRAFT_865989 [Obelidium mucronatum]|nr:hypothetical protein BDR26DRAFT_865989 [Obelidium mucronatum]
MNRCGALKWCWILVAVSGAFMVITLNSKDNFTNPPWSTLGDGLLIVNIVSYSTYLTFVGPLLSVYPPVLLTCWTYISGTALNAVCLVIAYAFWGKDVLIFSVKGIYGVLYGGVLSSTVAYLLINWTNQVTSPPVVTAFVPLQTVVAAGLSAVVFGEDVGWREVVGGIICCVGVFGLVYIRWRETILGSDLCSEEESRRRDRIATIDEVDENQASEETPLLNS